MRKLKKLPTENKIFLAPMEQVNDIVFRLLSKRAGAGLTWTPLTNPLSKQEQFLEDKPVLQLFCTATKGIKSFMKKYNKNVSAWDFNLGCPATNAKKNGFGAYLTNLTIIEKIIKTMRENTKKPLIVKIRKSSIAFEILKIAEKYCDAIAIHPRTRSQGYSGNPDIQFAKKIKSKTFLPIIYSGNVDKNNYKNFLQDFDYVMIARKAIGNPSIFSKKQKQIIFQDYLNLYEKNKYNFPFRQLKFQAMQFSKGKRNSKKIRLQIFKIKNYKELKDFINPDNLVKQ